MLVDLRFSARDTLIALRELIDEAIGDIDLYDKPQD